MTPLKLIMLRIFNITLGRFNFFSKLFKKKLIKSLIIKRKGKKEKGKKYVATSRYFDLKELK